ncbi:MULTISPECIES: iron-containing redox enzyme family protein [Ramlibacter]|uniref:Iron-containing redox enzyme family protein n=1 Tax=Ramlibacter aquaticus TaxID=2780094 RepID=A0ABR9S9S4_9BURK|nr:MULTISPECIES: iron-containing redox enzyme family protein [Ramlibacter]MBE7939086.1 iron-containing redox enzyme family protein [Ramlibacter aquaticus]
MEPSHHPNPTSFHRALAGFNAQRLLPRLPDDGWREDLEQELAMRCREGEFIEALRTQVAPQMPAHGLSPDAFMRWFEALAETGPGQHHPLFRWLAEDADAQDIRWFLRQEAAGEAGFEDLLAYTQVRLPQQPKLECARNFWDEMGHGKGAAMHGHLLERMVNELGLKPDIGETVSESLALSNAMVAMATSRRYAFHAIGALGVIELTAPGRVRRVADGMRRTGFEARHRAYFELHAALDVSHARAWLREVIRPLAERDAACARAMAEGALIRLTCGARCFDRYARELGIRQADAASSGLAAS